jgi:hypothetical protein
MYLSCVYFLILTEFSINNVRSQLLPRKFRTFQASSQTLERISSPRNALRNLGEKFCHIMRRKVCSVFADLGPNKFDRIELWCTDWKVIDMQAWMLRNEILNELAFMDGMVIPHQNDLAWNNPQHLLQKSNHRFTAQAAPIRASGQFDLAAIWADQQGAQQVQPLVMLQAGAEGRRMTTRRPTPFERRDQREAAFIFKYQRGQQFTPLFLSLARPAASRRRSSPRRVGLPGVAPFGCSNPCDPSHTIRHWTQSVLRTVPKSHDQSDRVSSNLRHIREHRRHGATLVPTVASAHRLDVEACRAAAHSSSSDFWLPDASVAHSVLLAREARQSLWHSCLAPAASARVRVFRQVVRRFHMVSYPYYHISTFPSDFVF